MAPDVLIKICDLGAELAFSSVLFTHRVTIPPLGLILHLPLLLLSGELLLSRPLLALGRSIALLPVSLRLHHPLAFGLAALLLAFLLLLLILLLLLLLHLFFLFLRLIDQLVQILDNVFCTLCVPSPGSFF